MSRTKYCETCDARFHTGNYCSDCGSELTDRKPCVFELVESKSSWCDVCEERTAHYGEVGGTMHVFCQNGCEAREYEPTYVRVPVYGDSS